MTKLKMPPTEIPTNSWLWVDVLGLSMSYTRPQPDNCDAPAVGISARDK